MDSTERSQPANIENPKERRGQEVNLLTPLEVERAQYVEQKSASGALLGNHLRDGDGLFLYVTPHNSKSWRKYYRFPKGGTKRVIVFGTFPAMSLRDARTANLKAKLLLENGQDPAAEKRQLTEAAQKAELKKRAEKKNTFRLVAQSWYDEELQAALKANNPKSESWKCNMSRWISWANEDFGNRPLPEIEAPDVLALIKRIAKEYQYSAENCRQVAARVFAYGIRNLLAPKGFNPAEAVKGAVIVPEAKHHPYLKVKDIPAFFADLDQHETEERLKVGIKILLHVFTRKEELAGASWSEFDFDAATWTIPAPRAKMRREHVIPLSSQVLVMFRRLRELAGTSPFVFPHRYKPNDKPMDGEAFNYVLRQMKYNDRLSPHGVRATAASALSAARYDFRVIDAQLAHATKSKTERAYFRETYLDQRRELLDAWSLILDGNVTPIGAAKAA